MSNLPNKIICASCWSSSLSINKTINNYKLYRCNSCGLIQTSINIKLQKKVNKLKYNDNYIYDYIQCRKEELSYIFKLALNQLESYKKGGNLLDVGCGPGLFLKTVRENQHHDWNLYGIDINKFSLLQAKQIVKANLSVQSIENNKLPSKYFNCITCFDVLEHSTSLSKAMAEITRLLTTKGILVIQAPNINSLMRYLCGADWDWWCLPDHTCHFSIESIKNLLLRNNFRIKTIFTWEHKEIFIKNIQGHIRKNITKIFFLNRIVSRVSYLPLTIIWYLTLALKKVFPIGGLIFIVSEKI